jgi:hypothetical protein
VSDDTCIRRAWLELGNDILPLEDDVAGYYCTELNLGYPEVREVMNNRPDMSGTDDRSQFFGSRAVSANIDGRAGAMTADQIATVFAHYMLPHLRPRLHYVLERPGEPERFVTVRAANYTWPISGSKSRRVQLNWVAADPTMYDPVTSTVQAKSGGGETFVGRVYPLIFDRVYETPGGGLPTDGIIMSPGDIGVRPLFRIHGPITAPQLDLSVSDGRTLALWFKPTVRIDLGHWVDIDTLDHEAYYDSDPARHALSDLDWANSAWPVLPVLGQSTTMTLRGSSTTEVTFAQAIWHDGYLT